LGRCWRGVRLRRDGDRSVPGSRRSPARAPGRGRWDHIIDQQLLHLMIIVILRWSRYWTTVVLPLLRLLLDHI
jgi:hypothetical protein